MFRIPYGKRFNNQLHSTDFPPLRGSKPAREQGVKLYCCVVRNMLAFPHD